MKPRFSCRWKPDADFGNTRIIVVSDAKARHYSDDNVQVWWCDHSAVARCTHCSGPLVAMSASCSHSKAAKRFATMASPPPKPKRKGK